MKKKIDNWVSNIILILSLVFIAIVGVSIVQAKRTGEQVFILGYRPIYVMTGSMEPYMMTDSICMTKKVDSLDELQVGDVVTFSVYSEAANRNLMITHRIIDIAEDGTIQTKGDNNDAPDNFQIHINDIYSKVVGVWNGFASIVHFFDSPKGIPTASGFMAVIVLGTIAMKCLKPDKGKDTKKSEPNT
jgi:signal peptidase